MDEQQLPAMVKCTTRHIRIFSARVDHGVLVPSADQLTLDVDPDNEFLWNDQTLKQVQQAFQQQVEARAGDDLNDYALRRMGSELEDLIRSLLRTGEIQYNPRARALNYSMGLPQQQTLSAAPTP